MFTDEEVSYLRGRRIGRLATARPDGTLQVDPVGFGVTTTLGTIAVGGFRMERSRTFGNVAADGQVAFVVGDVLSTAPWRVRFVEVRGRGEALTGPMDPAGGRRGRGRSSGSVRPGSSAWHCPRRSSGCTRTRRGSGRATWAGTGYSIASISPRWNARGVAGNPYRSWCRVPEPHHPQRPTAS
ncbi:PPOX class F420-dependent oxidoreductase [Pseudonocardia sp. ICBG1034]|uniref:PPOX class F420-dependent oxidoreductase n=1 Tax=Pseudonocardia sp. ICBG1034 TaxID=2844381 RepID=UPI001CCDA9C1|nr:PPOX class F420-dependent oxidoreductase [Pseudonocardia sp. ICBG1034]